jgi:putative endonuclease
VVSGPNQALGAFGENLAARWYEDNGYSVVAQNWRGSAGEIDLVLRRDRLIVISEVKTRTSAAFGSPAEAVGPAKQKRLRRLAAEWLSAESPGRVDIRFDVVSILAGHVEVIEAAF